MLISKTPALISASFVLLIVGSVSAGDWPTFRGSDRSAVSTDVGLLKAWPAEGPPVVWKAEGAGRGYASLSIMNGKIFTLGDHTTADDPDEYLLAYDQKTGELLWKAKTGAPWESGKADWQSSRSTPSSDANMVYVVTPHGNLVACDVASGREVWRKDFKEEFQGKKGDGWGFSESPLIDGDKLICTPGGESATIVALNKTTGDVLWKAAQPENRGAGHASIVAVDIGGQRVYLQSTASGAICVRASDGIILWTYAIDPVTAVIPTLVIKDDLVFFPIGYKRGGALIRQVPKPDGRIDIEEIFPMKNVLANKHGGVVRIGDYVYADSDDQGIPYCAELMTGEIKWKQRGSGKNSAAMAAADGHLYIHFADGTMVLAKANPAEYVEVGSFKVPGSGERPSWSHPVILDGKLYLRENNEILCFNIKE